MGQLALCFSDLLSSVRQVGCPCTINRALANDTRSEALTFNSWNNFLDAYPTEIKPQQEFHIYPAKRSFDATLLPSISVRLARLDLGLTTVLCIRDYSLTFEDLKQLINIPTLGTLILEQSRPRGVSELHAREFSNWGRAVRERNALQKLRALIMCDFGIGRGAILEAVAGFPTLTLLGLQNSKSWTMSDSPHIAPGDWQFLTETGYYA